MNSDEHLSLSQEQHNPLRNIQHLGYVCSFMFITRLSLLGSPIVEDGQCQQLNILMFQQSHIPSALQWLSIVNGPRRYAILTNPYINIDDLSQAYSRLTVSKTTLFSVLNILMFQHCIATEMTEIAANQQ